MAYYDGVAAGFLRGECCFVTRPMGYPLMLAGAYGLIGRGALAGEVLNIFAALAGAMVLAAVVRRAFGTSAAAIAVVLYACWPAGALMTTARMSETVYTSQLLVTVGAAVVGGTGAGWGLLTGALLGLSNYIRATSVALVPIFLVVRLLQRPKPWRAVTAGATALVLGFLVVLTPVIQYNLREHRERYHMYVVPLLLAIAAVGITHGIAVVQDARRERRDRHRVASLG
ncbi:MAG: glycosyltransferase family 39 protein [Chloroflexi bacterium]|nr:glycosyltransferase family 39 protein [Chloroflexota bacterium]